MFLGFFVHSLISSFAIQIHSARNWYSLPNDTPFMRSTHHTQIPSYEYNEQHVFSVFLCCERTHLYACSHSPVKRLFSFVMCLSVSLTACPSVCPRVSARLIVDGFSWNFILETFIKICLESPDLFSEISGTLYWDLSTFMLLTAVRNVV